MVMAANNITPRLANAEMGSPLGTNPDNLAVHDVTRVAGQNQYSFYGPWQVKPNATTKFIEIDYKTSDDRLGDFRLYNHSANKSNVVYSTRSLSYDPTATLYDMVLPVNMSEMNILNALSGYSSSALRLAYDFYSSSANRAAKTSRITQKLVTISWYTPTLLTNHTRTQIERASSTQTPLIEDVPLASLTTDPDYFYVDCYIANISGTELLRLGSAASDGYIDITMNEYAAPFIYGASAPSGSGLTGARVSLYTTSAKCSESNITLSNGATTYSFYVKIMGLDGTDTKLISSTANSAEFKIYHYNHLGTLVETLTHSNKTLSNSAGIQLSGSCLAMQYGHEMRVELDSVTWGTLGTACP